jgi:hypothetical protein
MGVAVGGGLEYARMPADSGEVKAPGIPVRLGMTDLGVAAVACRLAATAGFPAAAAAAAAAAGFTRFCLFRATPV